jgi:hypothetical protein
VETNGSGEYIVSKKIMTVLMLLSSYTAVNAFAEVNTDPCHQIRLACQRAGFVKDAGRHANGLWKDCVEPLMKENSSRRNKIPLPHVDASVIAACKAKHPRTPPVKAKN